MSERRQNKSRAESGTESQVGKGGENNRGNKDIHGCGNRTIEKSPVRNEIRRKGNRSSRFWVEGNRVSVTPMSTQEIPRVTRKSERRRKTTCHETRSPGSRIAVERRGRGRQLPNRSNSHQLALDVARSNRRPQKEVKKNRADM